MGWFVLASTLLLTTGATPLVEQIAETTADANVEVLQLDRERYNRLTVPVTIGEHGPFDFMVDTGAQATVLSTRLADQLGLGERQSARLIGMASIRDIETASIDGLALGSRTFDIEIAAIVEQANIGGADGILGLDSLQDQRVLLDFRERTIAVADAETLGGNRGYDIIVRARDELGQLVITGANIDGVRVAVIVDTGAQRSIGNSALRDRLRGRNSGTMEMTDINGVQIDGNVRIARDMRIGRARMTNIPVAFVESPTFAALGLADQPAMVLGMNELKLFQRVAIDFRDRRVLFDLPRGSRDWLDEPIGGSRYSF